MLLLVLSPHRYQVGCEGISPGTQHLNLLVPFPFFPRGPPAGNEGGSFLHVRRSDVQTGSHRERRDARYRNMALERSCVLRRKTSFRSLMSRTRVSPFILRFRGPGRDQSSVRRVAPLRLEMARKSWLGVFARRHTGHAHRLILRSRIPVVKRL